MDDSDVGGAAQAVSAEAVDKLTVSWAEMAVEGEAEEFAPAGDDVGEVEVDGEKLWAIVGRFLTAKAIKLEFMRQVMASVWQPVRGVQVTEIQPGLFLFVFYHDTDVEYVLDGGPWAFENNTLVCREVVGGMSPGDVPLDTVDMWVQLHDLPMGYTSQKVLEQAGNFIGKFVKHDDRFVGAPWITFYRIRVSIAVNKPLRRGMKLLKGDKTTCWVFFKYERLHKFCFFCGLMGHVHTFCLKARESRVPVDKLSYGAELRAGGNRGSARGVGESWLIPVGGKPLPMPMSEPESDEGDGGRPVEGRRGGGGSGSAMPRGGEVVATGKRRREGQQGCVGSEDGDVAMNDVSKNLCMAGATIQPRPSS
ncbi:PREDICTED: uncharacterized protein LOC109167423 [Ipomoea nil]|uniref:uncharacterized protein LOC109167423 n=1 Tax=Ipomoea nil TaxID=35883 RepID=UPI000900B0C3|nr:PREDICTED: uncharacterized protein LOC109167423 [Ipomoea nil]